MANPTPQTQTTQKQETIAQRKQRYGGLVSPDVAAAGNGFREQLEEAAGKRVQPK